NNLYKTLCDADMGYTPLNLSNREYEPLTPRNVEEQLTSWSSKELHGRFCNELRRRALTA
ncbi:hypothetical protein HHI36_002405, partial [Cryptolaemus montrouzieri]